MSNILHRIKAYLYKNVFAEKVDNYTARVATERLLKIQDICQSAVRRGGANVSPATMEYMVGLYLKEMAYCLCDGYAVDNDYFTLRPSIKGVFDSPDELFDPEKHRIKLVFQENEKLREALSGVGIQILGPAKSNLYITQVTDVKSGAINTTLTPKYSLKISGSMLKLAGNHPDVGVCFINCETGERTKPDSMDIIQNQHSELIVRIPELITGDYWLEITTQYTTSGIRKQPRTTTFNLVLKV